MTPREANNLSHANPLRLKYRVQPSTSAAIPTQHFYERRFVSNSNNARFAGVTRAAICSARGCNRSAFQYSNPKLCIGAVPCMEHCARRWQGPQKSSVRVDGAPTIWSRHRFSRISPARFCGSKARRQISQRQSAGRAANRARCGRSSGILAAIAIGRTKRSPSSWRKSCAAISRGSNAA